jgi:hypothetical protein
VRKSLIFVLLLVPKIALATDITAFGVNQMRNLSTYSTRNVYDTISGIINIVLGFLGTIALLLILFAGFLWLTSQGDSSKIDQAKKLIGAAVAMVVVVFSSYAVAQFIISQLYQNTIQGG